jgi:hypothetical protein
VKELDKLQTNKLSGNIKLMNNKILSETALDENLFPLFIGEGQLKFVKKISKVFKVLDEPTELPPIQFKKAGKIVRNDITNCIFPPVGSTLQIGAASKIPKVGKKKKVVNEIEEVKPKKKKKTKVVEEEVEIEEVTPKKKTKKSKMVEEEVEEVKEKKSKKRAREEVEEEEEKTKKPKKKKL